MAKRTDRLVGEPFSRPVGLRLRRAAARFLVGCVVGAATLEGQLRAESYTQTLRVRFADARSAESAAFHLAPLYDDRRRAVSCRWDDNWTSDNEGARELMEQFGVRGTWYLNDRRFSPTGGQDDYLPVARRLLRGGNSIGCHSLTHPFLTYFHANRMFAETAGCRVVWEAALDRPVISYAYSFIDLRPKPEGERVLTRTLDTLERAGFYHIAEYLSFFDGINLQHELSPIMPPENNPFDAFHQAVRWAYTDDTVAQHCPMVCNSMHAWYGTPRLKYGYDELSRRFETLRGLEDVWHCNQNQYAAYRRQYRSARLGEPIVRGSRVELLLTRPTLRTLNDETPLTLAVTGVAAGQVVGVASPAASVVPSERRLDDRLLYHVHHPEDQRLPATIGVITNPRNDSSELRSDADGDFPWLRGRLVADGERLRLVVEHTSEQPMEDCRVNWRTPIGWSVPPLSRNLSPLKVGERLALSAPLTQVGDKSDALGEGYFVAELDFRVGDQAGRIFLTCQRAGPAPDASWPRDGFALLGPLDDQTFDREAFLSRVRASDCPATARTANGMLAWRPQARDGYVEHDWLNPEYVRTMGTWDARSPSYALRTRVDSPKQRKVRLVTSHESICDRFINGAPVGPGEETNLREGENELVIFYPSATLSPATERLTACFVRLVDAETGERLSDIHYRPD